MGGDIWEETSGRRHLGGDIWEVSKMGGDIWEETSGRTWISGSSQEAPRAPRRLQEGRIQPETPQEFRGSGGSRTPRKLPT